MPYLRVLYVLNTRVLLTMLSTVKPRSESLEFVGHNLLSFGGDLESVLGARERVSIESSMGDEVHEPRLSTGCPGCA